MDYQPKKILVTGGAGFIGCHFIRYTLQHYPQIEIINLDKLTYAGSKKNLADIEDHPNYRFIKGNICNYDLVCDLLNEHAIDTVVHFAAESHVDRSIDNPMPFIETNIVGTFQLLEACRQQWLVNNGWDEQRCRFHHISTDEVYGCLHFSDPAFTETTAYAPNSPYSASKASSDHLVRAYFQTYGLPVTTSNCSNNYGPYQHSEKFIPTVIRRCLEKKSIPIYGDGSNIRDWLYVVDHCAALWRILEKGYIGEVYNIGGNAEKSNLDMVHLICNGLAHLEKVSVETFTQLITFVDDRPGHDWRYAINAQKIKQQLGWHSQYTLSEGLEQTIAWYLTHATDFELSHD